MLIHNTVDYKGREKDTVAFIDGLGSVDDEGARPVFWTPTVGRISRSHYKDVYQPEIVVNFPDERSCIYFKLAVVASRDSLNIKTAATAATAAISQSMDYRSHDFEWSASDDPFEITCLPTCSETMVTMYLCIVLVPFSSLP